MKELHILEEDIKATKQAEEQAMVLKFKPCQIITLKLGHLQTSSNNNNRTLDITKTKVSYPMSPSCPLTL